MLTIQGGFSLMGEGTPPVEEIDITLGIANHRIVRDEGYEILTVAYARVKNVAVKQSVTSPEYQASINPADVFGDKYRHNLRDWLEQRSRDLRKPTIPDLPLSMKTSFGSVGKQTSLDAIVFVKDQGYRPPMLSRWRRPRWRYS
ncbi:MAG: hypothetical protein Q9177_001151 [Variospora cf. flavescens]